MSSTFRRKSSSSSHTILPGTKAWTGGTTLASTGLRELDAIIGSGQPLGTCIFVEEDRWTGIGSTLVSYWCSEGLVHGQNLIVPVTEEDYDMSTSKDREPSFQSMWTAEDSSSVPVCCSKREAINLVQALPFSLNIEQQHQKISSTAMSGEPSSTENVQQQPKFEQLDTVTETIHEEEDDDDDDAEEGLVVAWQYRKEVQSKRLGISSSSRSKQHKGTRTYCHSFDLQRTLQDQLDITDDLVSFVPVSFGSGDHRNQGYTFFIKVKGILQTASSQSPKRVLRLLLLRVHPGLLAVAFPMLLNFIRRNSLPVVICISQEKVPSCVPPSLHLQRHADVVLAAEGFAGRRVYPPPAEFRHFVGLLHIRKASTCTSASSVGHWADATTQKRPAAHVYGVKRDRRKLHLSLLHIPPEDYATGGGSVGSSAVRSGAGIPAAAAATGLSCASPSIDF